MKYFWFGLALLAALLGTSLFAVHTVKDYTGQATAYLQQAEQAAAFGDFDLATDLVQEACTLWNDSRGASGVLLRHTEADDIQFALASLLVCAKQGAADEFFRSCEELIAMLDYIADMERPFYYNLL